MLKLETRAELDALHTGNVKESLYIEYKASPAIDKKDDTKKLEMARDVSAFANADGGQIIYGMTEQDHEPAGIDAGIDPRAYPEIWFEQVLQQHVTPTISGLRRACFTKEIALPGRHRPSSKFIPERRAALGVSRRVKRSGIRADHIPTCRT